MKIRSNNRADAGTVLVTSLAMMVVLVAASAIYLYSGMSAFETSNRELDGIRARLASEEGVYRATAELATEVDTGTDGIGNVVFQGPDGRAIQVTSEDLGGDLFRVTSRGSLPRATIGSELVARIVEGGAAISFDARAAIAAEGPVTTLGQITVDGRGHDAWGNLLPAPGDHGVYGISSGGAIEVNGSSVVGGNGAAPVGNPGSGAIEENATWADGIDDDGDGTVDEEAFDGIDNDGDGAIDEDVNSFPSSPDVALHVPEGTLKAAAQAAGTYFDTEADFEAYLAANGGDVPGGEILYLDFDEWLPADFGVGWNDPPSVLVHHNAAGNALMKNLHGRFRGLIMADFVEHINGTAVIVGAMMSFTNAAHGNAFGNGSAEVLYSPEVLLSLPTGTAHNTRTVTALSWRRASGN